MSRSISAIQIANLAALPVLGRIGGTRFWPMSRALARASRRPLAERKADQLRSLNALLQSAARNVPMIRERLSEKVAVEGLRSLDDIQSLPITDKSDMMSGFPDRVVDAKRDRTDWKFVSTSGTVSRVVTVKDFQRRDLERAAAIHSLSCGTHYRPGLRFIQIPPNICNIVCGEGATNEDESFRSELGHWLRNLASKGSNDMADLRGAFERRIVYRTRILSPLAPAGTQVDAERFESFWNRIRREKPFLLHALPEYLYLLAEWAIEEGRPPLGVPRIIPMGGNTTPYMRARIVEGLGGTFTDFYGTAELGPVAFECRPGDGLRTIMEMFLIEVVRKGRPAAPGELGKLLITDLANQAMPFLRYQVGDAAVWWPAPEDSRDQSPRIRVVGRLDEVLEGSDGEPIAPETLRDQLYTRGDCLAFSLRARDGRRLQIDYVPRGDDIGSERVIEAVRPLLHPDFRIKARTVGNIPAEASGKFRFIRSESNGVDLLDS